VLRTGGAPNRPGVDDRVLWELYASIHQ
jgi:hypothetical protein